MPRTNTIIYLCVVLIFNAAALKAQDTTASKPPHEKRFFHDLHLGLLKVHIKDANWKNIYWKAYVPSYSLKYVEKKFSMSFYLGLNSPRIDLAYFNNILFDERSRIAWDVAVGYNKSYFFKINRIRSVEAFFSNTPLMYVPGYIFERHYSITDYELLYSPQCFPKENMEIKIGFGLSSCTDREYYIISPGWHGNGWYEPRVGGSEIDDTGYIFEVEYYIRPLKYISFRAFTNYRLFKDIPSLFSYGVSGGLSF